MLFGASTASKNTEKLECVCLVGYEMKESEKDKFNCEKIEQQTIIEKTVIQPNIATPEPIKIVEKKELKPVIVKEVKQEIKQQEIKQTPKIENVKEQPIIKSQPVKKSFFIVISDFFKKLFKF
jgi:hypothetical protein